MSMRLDEVIAEAKCLLSHRSVYARSVIDGVQRWSGNELEGGAREWSRSYYQQRRKAQVALEEAGGIVLGVPAQGGMLTTAVLLGVDDYGVEVYDTILAGIVPATDLSMRVPK